MASVALSARRRVGDGRLMSASVATFELDRETAARDREFSHRMLAAVVYNEQAYPDEILRQVVNRCRLRGVRLAGVIQHRPRDPGHRCDMLLEDLATRRQTAIFASRGRGARGCQLDEYAMLNVVSEIELALKNGPELVVLNKFGKVEAEGMGMRDLITQAVCMGIPVIVGVPARNLQAWREFAGEFSVELNSSGGVDEWLRCRLTKQG
jgi:nucleoside-triphosphatase THEP1